MSGAHLGKVEILVTTGTITENNLGNGLVGRRHGETRTCLHFYIAMLVGCATAVELQLEAITQRHLYCATERR